MKIERLVLIGVIAFWHANLRAQIMTDDQRVRMIVEGATYKTNSLDDFDEIPYREKLYYAYRDIVIRSSSVYGPVVEIKDLELLMEAQKRSNFVLGAYERLKAICGDRSNVDALSAARALAEANELEYSEQDAFLRLIYDQLSQNAKDQVLEIIENLKGTSNLSIVRVDLESVAAQAPSYSLEAFSNMCSGLEENYNADLNPANTGTSIPLTIGE